MDYKRIIVAAVRQDEELMLHAPVGLVLGLLPFGLCMALWIGLASGYDKFTVGVAYALALDVVVLACTTWFRFTRPVAYAFVTSFFLFIFMGHVGSNALFIITKSIFITSAVVGIMSVLLKLSASLPWSAITGYLCTVLFYRTRQGGSSILNAYSELTPHIWIVIPVAFVMSLGLCLIAYAKYVRESNSVGRARKYQTKSARRVSHLSHSTNSHVDDYDVEESLHYSGIIASRKSTNTSGHEQDASLQHDYPTATVTTAFASDRDYWERRQEELDQQREQEEADYWEREQLEHDSDLYRQHGGEGWKVKAIDDDLGRDSLDVEREDRIYDYHEACSNCGYENCRCCDTCGDYPCKCCSTCNSHPCRCCSTCDDYPCKCCHQCGSFPCDCAS